jgi:hypothetical protein
VLDGIGRFGEVVVPSVGTGLDCVEDEPRVNPALID